jgi:hypothetical protein
MPNHLGCNPLGSYSVSQIFYFFIIVVSNCSFGLMHGLHLSCINFEKWSYSILEFGRIPEDDHAGVSLYTIVRDWI